jgi:hypothetical protein
MSLSVLLPNSAPSVRRAAARFYAAQAAARAGGSMVAMHDNDAVEDPSGDWPPMPMVRLLTEDAVQVQRNTLTGAIEVLVKARQGDYDTLPLADAIELNICMVIDQELDLFDVPPVASEGLPTTD